MPESKFRTHFYGDDSPKPPHADRIREAITKSAALFVLLSDSMLDPERHARVWVPFEVGVAAAHDLPVVVIDPKEGPVSLPVPGATHYVQRPQRWDGTDKQMWSLLASTGGKLSPVEPLPYDGKVGEKILTFLSNAATMDQDETGIFVVVDCDGADCRTKFWVPVSTRQGIRHPCPSCRQGSAGFMVKLQETVAAIEARRAGQLAGSR